MTPEERAAALIKEHNVTLVETDYDYSWGRVDDMKQWITDAIRAAVEEERNACFQIARHLSCGIPIDKHGRGEKERCETARSIMTAIRGRP